MKSKRFVPFFIALILLVVVLGISHFNSPIIQTNTNTNESTKDTPSTSDIARISTGEMRGVWVTYMELDMEQETDKSENNFYKKFENMVIKCRNSHFNTMIVQVRPFCDALYKSKIYPWSHILTGTQGKDPNYDPLKIMCQLCKKYGMKIHAWINPYRICSNNTPNALSKDNPYSKDKSLGTQIENGTYLNPANEKAQQLIIDGVTEIIKNYDVDGIQFDDYFYPSDNENFDKSDYQNYVAKNGKENSMSLNNWRIANVNLMVCKVYQAVHNNSEKVVFGISPQGNIENNKNIYADVKSWCSCKGFIDYICPQIYFSLGNPKLTFENSLSSWTNLEFSDYVTLYVGLAGYKASTDSDENTWKNSDDILAKEYNILKSNKKVKGVMLYSYNSFLNYNANEEISNLVKALN